MPRVIMLAIKVVPAGSRTMATVLMSGSAHSDSGAVCGPGCGLQRLGQEPFPGPHDQSWAGETAYVPA